LEKFKQKVKEIMEKINIKAKAKTGMDINFALILLGVFLFIVAILVIKGVLGWVSSSLAG